MFLDFIQKQSLPRIASFDGLSNSQIPYFQRISRSQGQKDEKGSAKPSSYAKTMKDGRVKDRVHESDSMYVYLTACRFSLSQSLINVIDLCYWFIFISVLYARGKFNS